MAEITREMLIRRVAEEAGYWQKDVRAVFNVLEEVILDYLSDVSKENEKVLIRLCGGIGIRGTFVNERERVDPRNRTPIVCPETIRLGTNYSEGFKKRVQEMYKEKKGSQDE